MITELAEEAGDEKTKAGEAGEAEDKVVGEREAKGPDAEAKEEEETKDEGAKDEEDVEVEDKETKGEEAKDNEEGTLEGVGVLICSGVAIVFTMLVDRQTQHVKLRLAVLDKAINWDRLRPSHLE